MRAPERSFPVMEKWQSLRKGKLATSRFEADVEFSEGTRSFGLRFYENEETSQSYQYLFFPKAPALLDFAFMKTKRPVRAISIYLI